MLLRDLLAESDLELVSLTGENELDRPVRGLYITDLLDPRRYLHGGELVLSGLAWYSGSADSEQFVAAIADAGVAGLAVGTARLGDAPDDLVDACRRHDVPAFQVPVAVSFNTLAERVRHATSGRELTRAVASGADLRGVLTMAADVLGDCWVVSPAGWSVGVKRELDPGHRKELVRAYLRSPRLPWTVTVGDDAFVLWTVASEPTSLAARWFLAIRGDRAQWAAEWHTVAAELGTAVALLRARVEQEREIAGRSVEDTLHRLLAGTAGSTEVVARLEAGHGTGTLLRVASLTAGGDTVTLLREIAAAIGVGSVTVPMNDGATALFMGEQTALQELDDRLGEIVDEIDSAVEGLGVGLSDTVGFDGLRPAIDEARYACRLATRRPGNRAMVTGTELASHRVLLTSVPDELRESYRKRVLGTVLEYDRAHDSTLVATLRVFLECAGSWSRCAQRLHVHVNTLRYRIRRIEELTGRDLGDFGTRVDFYLALQLDQGPLGEIVGA